MKTFETEKHNIPEGATHYDNESCLTHFAWFKLDGDNLLCMPITYPDRWFPCNLELYKDSIKPIPQTKEVEWVNGDECRYSHDVEHEYVYVGEHPHGDGHYVFSEEKGIT